jgi:hypothetical protein
VKAEVNEAKKNEKMEAKGNGLIHQRMQTSSIRLDAQSKK